MAQAIREILRASEVFKALTDGELAKVEPLCRLMRFKAGELVVEEDARSDRCFVLGDGRVDVEIKPPVFGRSPQKIATVRPGETLGELSLLDGYVRSASARASDDATVVAIDDGKLRDLLEAEPSIGFKVMKEIAKVLASRIRDTNLRLRNALTDMLVF